MRFHIGQKAKFQKKITKEDVVTFASITGDNNPIHSDEEFAKTTIFKKPIVHGMLCSSLISAVIAEKLPGKGSIYLGQNLKFIAPVFHNDLLVAEVCIKEIIKDKNQIILDTTVIKNNKIIVIEGWAKVKVSEV